MSVGAPTPLSRSVAVAAPCYYLGQPERRKLLCFMGPPGVGKTTQAKRFAAAFSMVDLSTGDELRSRQQHDASGGLSPDTLVLDIVEQRIQQMLKVPGCNGLAIHGFPRRVTQCEAALDFEERYGLDFMTVALIPSSLAHLPGRIDKRVEELGDHARDDDTREVLGTRIEVFQDHWGDVIGWLSSNRCLVPVDADGSVDQVYSKLLQSLYGARVLARS